jgi:hypothetical protein
MRNPTYTATDMQTADGQRIYHRQTGRKGRPTRCVRRRDRYVPTRIPISQTVPVPEEATA